MALKFESVAGCNEETVIFVSVRDQLVVGDVHESALVTGLDLNVVELHADCHLETYIETLESGTAIGLDLIISYGQIIERALVEFVSIDGGGSADTVSEIGPYLSETLNTPEGSLVFESDVQLEIAKIVAVCASVHEEKIFGSLFRELQSSEKTEMIEQIVPFVADAGQIGEFAAGIEASVYVCHRELRAGIEDQCRLLFVVFLGRQRYDAQ